MNIHSFFCCFINIPLFILNNYIFLLLKFKHLYICFILNSSVFIKSLLFFSRCKNTTRVCHFLLQGEGIWRKVKIFYGICGPFFPIGQQHVDRFKDRMIIKKDTARSTSTSSATMSLL